VGVPSQSAVLGLLMLRGPQTAGELRINTERWHRFADISSVEAFLDELRERSEEKAARWSCCCRPRRGEARWAHLLCGPVDVSALAAAEAGSAPRPMAPPPSACALEAEVALLRATVQQLCSALGVEAPVPHSGMDSAEQNPPAEI
jgi:uncharacterized protein YceH (UPF0502 family)